MTNIAKTTQLKGKFSLILLICMLCVMLSGFGALSGLTMDGASLTHGGFLGLVATQSAWFTPAWVVTPDAGFGLVSGKKVNRAYVRIKEGTYDSERVWTDLASDSNSWATFSKQTSKMNDPFFTMYAYYGWQYFN